MRTAAPIGVMLTDRCYYSGCTNIVCVIAVWSAITVIRLAVASSGCYLPGAARGSFLLDTNPLDKYGRHQVGAIATFGCDPGYELIRNETLICQRNGSWSGVESICAMNVALRAISSVMTPSKPADLLYDGLHSTCYSFRSKNVFGWWIDLPHLVEVEAIKLLYLDREGDTNSYLASYEDYPTENWKEFDFDTVSSKRISIDGNMYLETLMMVAKGRIKMVNEISIQQYIPGRNLRGTLCEVGVYTSSELEKCMSPFRNEITIMKLIDGMEASYSCPEGYKLKGDSRRVCVKGKWTGSAPKCEVEITCPLPFVHGGRAVPLNGNITVGSWMQIVCDIGLFLPLDVTDLRRCQPSGNWSGQQDGCDLLPVFPYPFTALDSDNKELVIVGGIFCESFLTKLAAFV